MNHSTSNTTGSDQTPEKSLSLQKTIGLALFALSLSAIFVTYLPYTLSTIIYGRNLGDAPPEIQGLSGPAVMGLWGITAGSFILLVQVGVGYLFRWDTVIERLKDWSLVITILSAVCFLGYLYSAISHNHRIVFYAALYLAFGLYQALVTWLLSKQST